MAERVAHRGQPRTCSSACDTIAFLGSGPAARRGTPRGLRAEAWEIARGKHVGGNAQDVHDRSEGYRSDWRAHPARTVVTRYRAVVSRALESIMKLGVTQRRNTMTSGRMEGIVYAAPEPKTPPPPCLPLSALGSSTLPLGGRA